MSRSSVLESTLAIPELLQDSVFERNYLKLLEMLKSHLTFVHVSDLVAPTLLLRQSGSFLFNFTLSVKDADELGTGREYKVLESGRSVIYHHSRVLIRLGTFQAGEFAVDVFPIGLVARVNSVSYRSPLQKGPLDITDQIKLNPEVINQVIVDVPSYTGFLVVSVVLVKTLDPTTMFKQLTAKRVRPAGVTAEKFQKNHALVGGADVAVTSTEVSLVCPLSQRRFVVPALGESCQHIACFDLLTFLKLNVCSRRWLCPICNKKVLPSHLIVDGFFKNVLDSLVESRSDSCTIVVGNQGEWSPKTDDHPPTSFSPNAISEFIE